MQQYLTGLILLKTIVANVKFSLVFTSDHMYEFSEFSFGQSVSHLPSCKNVHVHGYFQNFSKYTTWIWPHLHGQGMLHLPGTLEEHHGETIFGHKDN